MSFNSKYAELRKKRLLEEENSKNKTTTNNTQPTTFDTNYPAPLLYSKKGQILAPIATQTTTEAPITSKKKEEEEEKRTWFQGGAFDDGYDFGDVTKTILGTVADVGQNIGAGVLGMGEKATDAVMGVTSLSLKNNPFLSEYEKEKRVSLSNELIEKDLFDEDELVKAPLKNILGIDVDDYSVLGEKTDSLAQSGGQLLGTVALQAAGVPWYLTTGMTSYGGEVEGALREGATIEEANLSAAISAGAEILTEKISGGISFGGKTLDDALTKSIARGISNKTVRTLTKLGVDMAGEGAEEVLSGAMSAIGQKITYADDKELSELFSSEEALESFIGGAVLGGVGNVSNVVKSEKKGVDAVTGLTKTEQSVVDKVYKDRIAEAEENGKIKEKEKSKIYDDVLRDLEKGYISTDTIESVLGGDTYKSYKDTIDSEDALKLELEELRKMKKGDMNDIQQDRLAELKAMNFDDTTKRDSLKTQLSDEVFGLVKDSRLAESYNEQGRRGQYFEADLSNYDKKYRDIVQKAIDSKTLNNTNRTHELVDMIAKISADKGVSFDFTNNAKLKETGFAIDGTTINGYVTKDGIMLNTDSAKYLNSVVGHEVTHVLEGTELYQELQNTLIEYAKTKNDYQGRYDSLTALYKDVEGADINAELTADLVGDYLFSDTDFISKLSTEHRNVFQKIYDEIKYLYKVATAGSKEARELEKVKKAFDKAYKESGKVTETKFSLSDSDGKQLTKEQQEYFKDSKMRDENGNLKVMYHGTATGEFSIFDKARGNVEGDFGSGFYFTDNEADVSEHYEGGGPDFDIKVDRRAEQIYNEALDEDNEISYEEAEKRAREELYKGSHKFEVYLNIENPAIVGETYLLEQDKYLEEYSEEDYDDYDDYIADVEQLVADDIEGIVWEIEKNVDVDKTDGIAEVLYEAYYEGGIGVEELKAKINNLYLEDSEGILVGNEVTRQIIESLGYDGIIDPTVAGKWNMDIEPGTTHYIAFKPNQIKSISNQNPTDNPDIHRSLSRMGEQPKKYGNLHIKGEDVAYQGIAPIKKTVTEDVFPDDYAPITEQDAADLQRDSLASIDEADMPPESNTEYYDIPDNTKLDTKAENSLVNTLNGILNLDGREKAVMREVVQKYSTGEIQTDAELFDEIKKQFGERTWTTKDDVAAEVKHYLRTTKVKVSDTIKGDIPNYNNFRLKNCWGKVRVSNEGVPVDSLYMELSELYPSFFPEDIANPTDQFMQMVEVANTNYDTVEGYKLEDTEIQAVVNIISSEIGKYKEAELMKSAEADRKAFMKEVAQYDAEIETTDGKIIKPEKVNKTYQIQTVEERLQHKLNHSYGELSHNKRLQREAIADYNNEIESLELEYNSKANKNTKVANNILRRIERLKRIRDDVDADFAKRINDNRAKVEKYKALLEEGYSAEEGRLMRSDLHVQKIDEIKSEFSKNGLDFDDVLKKAKNLSTFATVDNTPQRVMEKSLGYKGGQVLADITVNKVAQNETEGIKWLNSITSREGKGGLLKQLSKKYHIKPGSKESAAAQMYAEGFYINENDERVMYGDAELAKDFPSAEKQRNIKGLASDPRIRQFYNDSLTMINESRTRNAYPEIKPLDNYFLHFRAMDDTFSRLGIPFNPNDIKAKDLPTDLNGVTADLKPGQPYFASAMHRRGDKTTYDLLGGMERYASGAKNQIYHIDDIQTLRALRNYIADTYGQANGLENLDTLSEEEVQDRIKQVFGSHLSTFAKFLNEEANVIAGKTALIDRGLEGIIGRRGIQFLDTINKQVGSNMVGMNVSSAGTNFLPIVQAFAKTNKTAFVKGFTQTVANKVGRVFGRADSFADNPTAVRRKGADRFYRTPWQKTTDAGYAFMSAVDNISTEVIVRAKYNEFIKKGMSQQQAISEADKWASRIMGDRSLGQMPQLYNSKMLGLITKFQLEVRNQLDSQFYDTIQETKASNADIENGLMRNSKTAAKVAATFVELAVAQHIFGSVFESIAGYNPAFDIIGVMIKALGFDDDEESEDTALDNIEQGFLALLEDLPYSSVVTDGGRIPISSALPIGEIITGEDEYGNEKSRLDTLGEIAPYYLLPTGYGQLKKTTQGLSMFDSEHPIAGSYTDSGGLRFPIDDTLGNRIQAGVFGQWASENASDYLDNERAPLKEKQIQEFIDVGMSIQDYWKYREGLSEYKTLAEKAEYINSLGLSVEQKNVLINNIADREEDIDMSDYGNYGGFEEFDFAIKNPEKYEFLQTNNISFAEYNESEESKELYNWAYRNPERITMSKAVGGLENFKRYSDELYDIKGVDNDGDGRSDTGTRKENVVSYLNGLDIDYYEKLILFKSEYNADDTYNYEIVDYLNGRDDISYSEMETILKELGFDVSADGTITWD